MNKVYKHLIRLIINIEKTHVTSDRNERDAITTDSTDIKKVMNESYK